MASAHFPHGVQQNRWRSWGCQSHTNLYSGLELAPAVTTVSIYGMLDAPVACNECGVR